MNKLFIHQQKKNNYLQSKTITIVIVSIIIIIFDIKYNIFSDIKNKTNDIIGKIYLLSNDLNKFRNNLIYTYKTHQKIISENYDLKKKLLLQSSDLLLIEKYKQENSQLRKLLNSPLNNKEKKMVTKIITIQHQTYNDQIIIDKGKNDGVYIGQIVINDVGVVGQVITANKFTSRIILICNTAHALPVQILRNNIRLIAIGNGCNNDLHSEYLSKHVDIKIGDVLVTSGLDESFPPGYPVAIVSSVNLNKKNASTIIKSKPIIQPKYLNYLLLIWNTTNKDINNI